MKLHYQAVIDMSLEDVQKIEDLRKENELDKDSRFVEYCIKFTINNHNKKVSKNGSKN
jgi:hypothetical protein